MVSGSYGHACVNKTCSVHPPSWVSCCLHFLHFNNIVKEGFEPRGVLKCIVVYCGMQ